MELFFVLSGIVLGAGSLISSGVYYGHIRPNKVSKSKLSDQQLLRLMYYHRDMTSKDLSNMTELTSTEAMARLNTLSNNQMIEYNMGFTSTRVKCSLVNEIIEEVKIVDFLKLGNAKIDTALIQLLASYNKGRVSSTLLTLASGLDISKTKKLLKSFKRQGVLSSSYNSYLQLDYRVAKPIKYLSLPPTEEQTKIAEVLQNPIGYTEGTSNSIGDGKSAQKGKFSDAEIIKAVIEHKGKLSATGLCLVKEISIEEANEILEGLHSKGVFDIRVSENGTIEYWLNDISLLS